MALGAATLANAAKRDASLQSTQSGGSTDPADSGKPGGRFSRHSGAHSAYGNRGNLNVHSAMASSDGDGSGFTRSTVGAGTVGGATAYNPITVQAGNEGDQLATAIDNAISEQRPFADRYLFTDETISGGQVRRRAAALWPEVVPRLQLSLMLLHCAWLALPLQCPSASSQLPAPVALQLSEAAATRIDGL